MNDPETFLTEVYVLIDDLLRTEVGPPPRRPGPAPALSPSETATLALFSQWARFASEREFYRYATARLRGAFPTLPSRPQFNRQVRRLHDLLARLATALGRREGGGMGYEVVDGTAVPTRNAKRRGAGWLPGVADIGFSNRLGWYEGVRLLASVTPTGAVTGFGVGPASANDRHLADTFFAARAAPHARLPGVGAPPGAPYLADMGFAGRGCQARWAADHGAAVVAPPQPHAARRWDRAARRWFAGRRQVVETVFGRLQASFRLAADRPHALDGLLARLAAKVALHNACLCLNRAHGRPALAIADTLGW